MGTLTKNLSLLLMAALASGLLALPASAQQGKSGATVTVRARGVSEFRPNRVAQSREAAIESAQRDAVEQASGVFIESQTKVRNYELVRDEVLSRSEGFIKSFKILKEGRERGLYQVSIEAEVVKSAFIKDVNASLEALYRRVGMPRVMVVITERSLDEAGNLRESQNAGNLKIVEKVIRKILNKQGFTFIDARSAAGLSLLDVALQGEDIARDKAIAAARTTPAEIIILGHASTVDKGSISKMNIAQANVALDVIRVDSGQILASEVASGRGLNVNKETAALVALQKAAQAVTPRMIEQVTYHWIKERSEGSRIDLVVKNVSFGDLLVIRRALGTEISGVKKVTQRSFSKGVALIELKARATTEEVAESLYTTEFAKFSLEVIDISGKKLTVSLVKK